MSERRTTPLLIKSCAAVRRRRRAATCLLIVGSVLTLPGCAVYTPYQVFRFTGDYNTERRISVQGEVFEHLPSRPVRVRLNQWAYNVGPQTSTSSMPIPANAPVAPAPAIPPTLPPAPDPTLDLDSGPPDPDLLDESQPPAIPQPPYPRTDMRTEQPGGGRTGPSARADGSIRGASYAAPSPLPKPVPAPDGAWLFGH